MAKLTLSVDPSVISRAKRFAKQRGVSVSEMVEAYLDALSEPSAGADVPPVLRSLRGTLKKVEVKDYERHLTEKYR